MEAIYPLSINTDGYIILGESFHAFRHVHHVLVRDPTMVVNVLARARRRIRDCTRTIDF
jgi:hypothetical protein